MSEANAEDRYFACEVTDQIDADAGVLRRAGAGGDDDALRLHIFDFSNRDPVVAANLDCGPEFPEILDEVEGKGIVIVENEDHHAVLIAKSTREDFGCVLGLCSGEDRKGSRRTGP